VSLIQTLHQVLREDNGSLLKDRYQTNRGHFLEGYCYVASETLYHFLGGSESPWTPVRTEHIKPTHWWLEHQDGTLLDPTAGQYLESDPPYDKGKRAGFLTKQPSQRTQILLQRLLDRLACEEMKNETR
jgi:hypothetical protein